MIFVPIIAIDTKEALRKISMANALADAIEIRLNAMESFACLAPEEESAEGQIPAAEMKRLMEGLGG